MNTRPIFAQNLRTDLEHRLGTSLVVMTKPFVKTCSFQRHAVFDF